MKTKHLFSLALISLLCLAGCDSSVSSSSGSADSASSSNSSPISEASSEDSSPDEISSSSAYTIDDVTYDVAKAALDTFAHSSVQSYSYHYRRYQDNYNTGDIYTNTAQVLNVNVHEDGVEGTLVNSTPSQVLDLAGSTPDNVGRVASYSYDDDYFIYGYQCQSDSNESFAQYVEKNPWNSAVSIFDYFTDNVESIYLYFTEPDSDSTWGTIYGYIHNGFSVEETEDAFVCSYTVNAEAEGYYTAEDGCVSVSLSKDDLSVVSCYYSLILYDPDYSSDPNEHANSYTYYGFSDVTFGDPLTEAVEPLDLDAIPYVSGAPEAYSTIELEDGDLTEQNVMDIFTNIDAYEDGAIKTEYESVAEVYDSSTYETIGDANVKGSSSVYQDYIWVNEETITMQDITLAGYNYSSVSQYTIGEEGIDYAYQAKFEDGSLASESSYTISADYISSLSYYFDASLTSCDTNLQTAIDSIASSGFGTVDYSYMKWSYTLTSAVKEGSTITIKISYSAEYSWSDPVAIDFVISIEDDFLTSSVDTDADGNVSTYTATKGDLPEFTGTLL